MSPCSQLKMEKEKEAPVPNYHASKQEKREILSHRKEEETLIGGGGIRGQEGVSY